MHYGPEAVAEARSATQANLNADQVANFPFPDCSLAEQRRIADFLDDRVTRIDLTIAARRHQIDSVEDAADAEWSQEDEGLAATYALIPIRRVLCSITDGPFGSSLTSSHYTDAGTRVIRLGNLGLAEFRDADKAYISDDYASQLTAHAVRPGDLLMAGLGDDRWPLGRSVVAPAGLGPAIVKADCYRLRLDTRVRHDYAAAFLSGPRSRALFQLVARGSTRARLNTDLARNAEVPLAPTAVQETYAASIRAVRRHAASTRTTLQRSIDLLSEYKQSLITGAVTGELDVTTARSGIPG